MPFARLITSLVIAAGVIALLLWWGGVQFGDIAAALSAVDLRLFALLLVVQASIHAFRAQRLRGLLRALGASPPRSSHLVGASAAWILDSQVLPGRIGEASLVLHLRRIGVSAEHGVVGLLLSRLLDLFMLVATLGGVSLLGAFVGMQGTIPFLYALGAFMCVLALLLGFAIFRGGELVAVGAAALRILRLNRIAPGARLLAFTARVESALHAVPRAALLRAGAWSTLVCAAIIAAYVVLGTAVGLRDLGAFEFVFGSTFAILGSLIPISGFLGIGAFDMAWAFGFAAVGVPEEHAVATGFAFHLLYLVSIAIHGAIGHAILASRSRVRAAEQPGLERSE